MNATIEPPRICRSLGSRQRPVPQASHATRTDGIGLPVHNSSRARNLRCLRAPITGRASALQPVRSSAYGTGGQTRSTRVPIGSIFPVPSIGVSGKAPGTKCHTNCPRRNDPCSRPVAVGEPCRYAGLRPDLAACRAERSRRPSLQPFASLMKIMICVTTSRGTRHVSTIQNAPMLKLKTGSVSAP